MSSTLIIHHNLFLTREQRYALSQGQDVSVVGISIPTSRTDLPAREVFCRYHIKNSGKDESVKIEKDGYRIVLPQKPGNDYIHPDLLKKLSSEEREKLQSEPGVSVGKSLLDVKDGGSEVLYYREHVQQDEFYTIHLIQIRDVSVLLDSLDVAIT